MTEPEAAEDAALAALDPGQVIADLQAFVRIPSPTGREREALAWLAARAAEEGLDADLHEHDLDALRAHPGHRGVEAPREELWNLTAALPAAADSPAPPPTGRGSSSTATSTSSTRGRRRGRTRRSRASVTAALSTGAVRST